MARDGVYARMRHPQYVAFVLVLTGFLLQWPTLLTLASYPVLVWAYARLARREEKDCLGRFGDEYVRYMQQVPAFIPRRIFPTQGPEARIPAAGMPRWPWLLCSPSHCRVSPRRVKADSVTTY